jgi:hypothetical protein
VVTDTTSHRADDASMRFAPAPPGGQAVEWQTPPVVLPESSDAVHLWWLARRDGPVGIDVERLPRPPDHVTIAWVRQARPAAPFENWSPPQVVIAAVAIVAGSPQRRDRRRGR